MLTKILLILILAAFVGKSYSISCFSCEGLYEDLIKNNESCSVISHNESCYTTIGFAIDTGGWIISMGGFNVTVDLPGYYVKPKSGSSFYEMFWMISNEAINHQLEYARIFCYKDFCNPISIIQKYINSDISYEGAALVNPTTECLVCNATDYKSAEVCKKTQSPCSSCSLTANQTLNDLYNYTEWSSSCYTYLDFKNKFRKSSQFLGSIVLQYEIDTKLLNIYSFIECKFTICNNFDYMNKLLQSIKIII